MSMNRREFLGLAAAAAGMGLTPLGRAATAGGILAAGSSVILEDGLNFSKGPYGTCINGQTFQQEAIVSFGGRQYAAGFADGGVLCVGRRTLPEGKWEVIRFDDYRIRHNDVHNVAVVGICPADGSIHLAFDHHASPLHYRRTSPGVALRPEAHAWEPGLFWKTTPSLEAGQTLERVTYPLFFSTPQGRLQLVYRIGGSGDGDWFLAEYDAKSGWSVLGMLFSGSGAFGSSPSRCAYPNPFRYGPGDRLHATWCWRERPKDHKFNLSTNHGLHYAYSDDFGQTWKNNTGAVVGVLAGAEPQAISIDSQGIRVWDVPYLKGMMNTTTQYVDPRGRVHVINWQLPAELDGPNLDMNQWRYDHYWREPAGTWRHNRLPFHGRKPQIAIGQDGQAWVVFCRGKDHNYHQQDPGGDLCIATASEESGWADWRIVHAQKEWFVGEPLLDLGRWKAEQVLSVYIQSAPKAAGAPSPLRVLEFARS